MEEITQQVEEQDNMSIYNATREVPKEALKEIIGGKLKGKSDINPMWRIKMLTEQFGPCGFGWYYKIDKQWLERNEATGEVAAFCNILLFVKHNGSYSLAIPGTGGSSFIASTRNGLEISDECYKMALTDAISVACKALGFGADVYWASDRTKYDKEQEKAGKVAQQAPQPEQGKEQNLDDAITSMNACTSIEDMKKVWSFFRSLQNEPAFIEAKEAMKAKISATK